MTKNPAKPRTHKFNKLIVTEGTHRFFDKMGKPVWRNIDSKRLTNIANNFTKLKESGVNIPAPWSHDADVIIEGSDGILEDSTKNAGFWDSVVTKVSDETGKTELWGVVEVPGDPNDPNSPAGRVGTSVKETSIYSKNNHVLSDGTELTDVPMHIALVTHGIEDKQKNFELQEDEQFIAMSMMVTTDDSIDKLSMLLKECFNIALPVGTAINELVPVLNIVLEQYKAIKFEEKETDNDTYEVPIIMASLNAEQQKALLDTKAINPVTSKPFTLEDLKAEPVVVKDEAAEIFMSAVKNNMEAEKKTMLRNRINRLVESGRTNKEFAESTLIPKVDSYTLSVSKDGVVEDSVVENVIMSLESNPATSKASQRDQEYTPPVDDDDMSEEDLNNAVNYMCNSI